MFTTSNKLKMALLTVVTCAGALQVGCKDGQVGAAIAGAAAAAIVVDVIHRQPPPPPPRYHGGSCRPQREEYCEYVSTYSETRKRCTYRTWDPCGGGWRKASIGTNSAADLAAASTDIAETYQLTNEGTDRLINALTAAQNAPSDAEASEAFATIGLSLNEMKALGESGAPSADMIDRVARALDQNPKHTAMMFASISETARDQAGASRTNESQR